MSNYGEFENINGTDTQNPLSPPPIQDNKVTDAPNDTDLKPHSAFSIVKNKIFEMYKIHSKNKKDQNK